MAVRTGPINIYTVILISLFFYLIVRTVNNISHITINREENTRVININSGQCSSVHRDPYGKIPGFIHKVIQDIVDSDTFTLPACTESERKKHFLYLQVYSCASESLANLFSRYILRNNLTALMPVRDKSYLGWPHYLHSFMYKIAKDSQYDALIHKMVYNRSRIAPLMPADTVYITNIRDPAYRLGAALDAGGMKSCGHMPKETDDVTKEFLSDMEGYDNVYKAPSNVLQIAACFCIKKTISIAKNAMAFDLGFYNGFHMYTRDKSRNYTFIQNWLKEKHSELDIMMIQERFNESLVLLKRYMCWGFKDILYKTVQFRDRQEYMNNYREEDITRFRQWTNVDTLLYEMASKTFAKRVDSLGEDFQKEVALFKQHLTAVNDFCNSDSENEMVFMASAWDSLYVVTREDCAMLTASWSHQRHVLSNQHDKVHGSHPIEDKWNYYAWC